MPFTLPFTLPLPVTVSGCSASLPQLLCRSQSLVAQAAHSKPLGTQVLSCNRFSKKRRANLQKLLPSGKLSPASLPIQFQIQFYLFSQLPLVARRSSLATCHLPLLLLLHWWDTGSSATRRSFSAATVPPRLGQTCPDSSGAKEQQVARELRALGARCLALGVWRGRRHRATCAPSSCTRRATSGPSLQRARNTAAP